MYKFDKKLEQDLAHLIGAELSQICIDPYNIHLKFNSSDYIHVDGGIWKLLDDKANLIDSGDGKSGKETYTIGRILSRKIKEVKVISSEILAVIFDNNWIFEIHDVSDQYECCAISPNIYI